MLGMLSGTAYPLKSVPGPPRAISPKIALGIVRVTYCPRIHSGLVYRSFDLLLIPRSWTLHCVARPTAQHTATAIAVFDRSAMSRAATRGARKTGRMLVSVAPSITMGAHT